MAEPTPLDKTAASLAQSDSMIRSLLEKLPVEIILNFKEHMKKLHIRQLKLVDDILQEKGYVEPTNPQV